MTATSEQIGGTGRPGFGHLWRFVARRRQRSAASGDGQGLNHGLTEEELRAMIAEDLRACLRRPMARGTAEGARPRRPFLLDRLVVDQS